MIPVAIQLSVADACDANPHCEIVSVTSNEPIDGLGDGDTAPDWIITGALTLELRAERAGTGSGGSTRLRSSARIIRATARPRRQRFACPIRVVMGMGGQRPTLPSSSPSARAAAIPAVALPMRGNSIAHDR